MDTPDQELAELLSTMDPETRTLFAEADLGEQCKEFVSSDIGRYLIGCARQEVVIASARLATTAPWRRRRIQQLQNEIWRAESLISWLRDLLLSAKSARASLEERE